MTAAKSEEQIAAEKARVLANFKQVVLKELDDARKIAAEKKQVSMDKRLVVSDCEVTLVSDYVEEEAIRVEEEDLSEGGVSLKRKRGQ